MEKVGHAGRSSKDSGSMRQGASEPKSVKSMGLLSLGLPGGGKGKSPHGKGGSKHGRPFASPSSSRGSGARVAPSNPPSPHSIYGTPLSASNQYFPSPPAPRTDAGNVQPSSGAKAFQRGGRSFRPADTPTSMDIANTPKLALLRPGADFMQEDELLSKQAADLGLWKHHAEEGQ